MSIKEITALGQIKSITPGGSTVMGSVSGSGAILTGVGFTVVRLAAGRYQISFVTPFPTTPVVLVTLVDPTPWRNVSGGAIVFGATSITPSGFIAEFEYPAGTFQDTPFTFMASLGYAYSATPMSDKTVGGIINGTTGAIQSGTGFTVVRTAAGDYTITFNTPFPSTPTVVATITAAAECTCQIVSASPTSVRIQSRNVSTFGLQDNDVHFIASLGFTYAPTTLLGKMIGGIIASNGAIAAGSGFTCVRNSAGNYTVTFSTPFSTAPIVTATVTDGSANRFCAITSVSTTGFTVIVNSSAGTSFDQAFNFTAQDPNLAIASSTLPAVPSAMTLICDVGPIPLQAVFDTQTILGGPIPQIYKHLILKFVSRSDGSGVLRLRLNNDSGTNYRTLVAAQGGATYPALAAQIDPGIGAAWANSAASAEIAAWLDLTLFDYAQATYTKRIGGTYENIYSGTSGGQGQAGVMNATYNQIAAIQRLALSLSAGNFTEAHFSLYGI